jgi:hypothetical protein
MIEIHRVPRFTLINIEHLGFCLDGTDKIIKEAMFLGMDGAWGKCFLKGETPAKGLEFVLGASTKVNLK